MSWDEPHGPVYDVVRVSTISDYQLREKYYQCAFVEIRRDYLLEYCRIKYASAVAFYYEKQWSKTTLPSMRHCRFRLHTGYWLD
ncbi:hypothetical protein [Achromobacter kerstersii]